MNNRKSAIENRQSKTPASTLRGKVYVVGDNIDTDQIIPAKYLNLVPTISEEYRKLGSYALSGLPADYPPFVRSGEERSDYSIIIAGRNFGCGSSREHAPVALGAAGVKAVVALSFARIFFRNSIATGELFPCESVERLNLLFKTGDAAEINLTGETIVHRETGKTFSLKSLGSVLPVVQAGGLFEFARKTGMVPRREA
jgi:3-isopropylmalate/(R)-2-methylmalate dehydratase small subunit